MPQKPRKRGRPSKHQLKQRLSLSISPEMRAKVQRIAKREHRSVSSLIEHWIDLKYYQLKEEKKLADPRTDSGIYRLGGSMLPS
jgi:hypothetical protein